MSHSRRADWAAAVPWSGIIDKPAGVGEKTDISQIGGAGFSPGDLPTWNGTKFVPGTGGGGGGGGGGPNGIEQLDSPGVATKRIKPGTAEFQYVWLREVFDVRQYGADNTGSGDSSGNFNSAITALNVGGGGCLVIPAGRYRITGGLNHILARCYVKGDGQGATILDISGDGFVVTSGNFFGCVGMTLNGSNPAGSGVHILDSATTDNFLLSDLRIMGFGFAIDVDTPLRSGWIDRCRLEASVLALSFKASDSFVHGVLITNGGDNTRNAFEMEGSRNQVSDFKLFGDLANFKKGLFVNNGGSHIISGGMIIGCDEEAISLSNGTGGVEGCRVQNISWANIGTAPAVVAYDAATNWVDNLYEIGTAGGGGGGNVTLVTAPALASDPGANNQIANDGVFFYSYKDTGWLRVAIATWAGTVVATGGTVTTDGAYTIHTFTTGGNFIVTTGGDIDYIVVGAGGGGGGFGGGGGGGFQKLTTQTIAPGTFPVVIGVGGIGVAGGSHAGEQGGDGTASSFNGLSADGGGGGGAFSDTLGTGRDGASGGGGGTLASSPFTSQPGGNATDGFSGGAGVTGATAAGGGGGHDSAGGNGAGTTGGAGGDGTSDSISGTARFYGAGGGGAGSTTGGAGGSSGAGGNGESYNGDTGPGATTPTANRGGGGGGKYANATLGSTAGADGVVVIRYLTP